MSPPKTVGCPACGAPVPWAESSRWRPFCSPRCKAIDLGDWASDRFVIVGDPLEDTSRSANRASQ
jgi:endogenous inhibitor of DNA gyrase (YacG/DUF329 family)